MLIVYLILWFIFNERITLELALVGLFVCLLVDVFTRAVLGRARFRGVQRTARLIYGAARYIGFLLIEIFKSNWAVIRLIVSPSLEVEPELHTFTTSLKTDTARVALANSITLTPGTITCSLEEDQLRVHALDASMAKGIDHTAFEDRLRELEAIADDA